MVSERETPKNVTMEGIEGTREAVEMRQPGRAELLLHELLRPSKIIDAGKAVVAAFIAEARSVHLVGEPLAPIDADLDVEREPALDARMHEAEDGIDAVVIEMQTLAALGAELGYAGFLIAAHGERRAGLDAGQQGDQPLSDAVGTGDLVGDGVFVRLARREVAHWAALALHGLVGDLLEARGGLQGELTEVLEAHGGAG